VLVLVDLNTIFTANIVNASRAVVVPKSHVVSWYSVPSEYATTPLLLDGVPNTHDPVSKVAAVLPVL
jgi:hypothetical protein